MTAKPSVYHRGGLRKDAPRKQCQNGQMECPGIWTAVPQPVLGFPELWLLN